MAQLGQHSAFQPAQQFCAFFIFDPVSIFAHDIAHFLPVGHGCTHIGQGRAQRLFQIAALARVNPHRFDVNHRFQRRFTGFGLGDGLQCSILRPADGHHRMDQPVNRQALRGHGRCHRIDQERHIVIDDGNSHEAPLVTG